MLQASIGQRMLKLLLQGVPTRRSPRVIAKMADTVVVSRSPVSREAIEAFEVCVFSIPGAGFRLPDTAEQNGYWASATRPSNLPNLRTSGVV